MALFSAGITFIIVCVLVLQQAGAFTRPSLLPPALALQPTAVQTHSYMRQQGGMRLTASAAPPLVGPRKSLSQMLMQELEEKKPQYSDNGNYALSLAVSAVSVGATGYYGYKLLPFVGRRIKLFGINFLADAVSPYVPLFIRRDPVLYQMERKPHFYDRFVSPTAQIKPKIIGRGATVRAALDYVTDNREAIVNLGVLAYSAAAYLGPLVSRSPGDRNS